MTVATETDPTPALLRQDELRYLFDRIAEAQCVSLVGVSNVGKSRLMRDVCAPAVRALLRPHLDASLQFFYIDCNRMLDQSEHAFYELMLRVLTTDLRANAPELAAELQSHYETILNPPNEFYIPLSFNQALTALLEQRQQRLVLVLDEFDAAYAELNPRIFLNLRALKDRYGAALTYLTATDRRLSLIRVGEQTDEFKELFGPHVHYVKPLAGDDNVAFIQERSRALGATFDANDIAFLIEQAGGHPGLTEIACRHLAAITGSSTRSDSEDWLIHRQLRDSLREDLNVVAECRKIWRDLLGEEQEAVEAVFQPGAAPLHHAVAELLRRGVLNRDGSDPQVFSALFEDFVQRRKATLSGPALGVRMDADSGEVWVDGRQIETLTRLEFRLLLLLYGHLNRICTKYEIVEAVWGEEYIDEVYDASIEKLVSRLRRKIEADPRSPRYLLTVRGRGYKLMG